MPARPSWVREFEEIVEQAQTATSQSCSSPMAASWSSKKQEHGSAMRLDIYGMFVVSVVTPQGGWSKGRPIAFVEEGDTWRPTDMLIPNGLSDKETEHYVADKYAGFARPGRQVRRLDARRLAA
jgi:hypothetical protein